MLTYLELISKIKNGEYKNRFVRLYGENEVETQKNRYISAVNGYIETFGEPKSELCLFSAPGRTEIGGNHTDHNHGKVLAGSVNLDIIAVVSPTDNGLIRIFSKGFSSDEIDINDLAVKESEYNTSASLIRGTAARFSELGLNIGGFNAYVTSDVLKGSGLSSSAAFEVLVGTVLNHLYNGGNISPVDIAKTAQFAENKYFGKPSGLMDQMASSVGNIISIDFADTNSPVIEKIDFDFDKTGYSLCIIDVGGNHADLTDEYAAVPNEMRAVAKELGAEYLRETTLDAVLSNIEKLRNKCGDRAVLRAMHFFKENERVEKEIAALKENDFEAFKKLVISSGESSFCYLQNVFVPSRKEEQCMPVALTVAEHLLYGKGAWRVHGGGFGGTIQTFVPNEMLCEFKAEIEKVFGKNSCHILRIRPVGGVRVDK